MFTNYANFIQPGGIDTMSGTIISKLYAWCFYSFHWIFYLVEVYVVVEGNKRPGSSGPEPRQGIPADGQEDESHVELQSFCCPLGRRQAIAHDAKCRHVPVLDELPGEEASHHYCPKQQNPTSLPVLQHKASDGAANPLHCVGWSKRAQVLAPANTGRAERSAVIHVSVLLQKQSLQLPQLKQRVQVKF